jgi:spore coat protein A
VPDPTLPATTGQIMQFRVVARRGADNSEVPSVLGPGIDINPASAVRERTLMLSELGSSLDNVIFGLLGGSPVNATADNPTGGLHWDDPVTETPKAGTTEIWNIVNATGDAHPIHVHLVQFQVLGRQLYNMTNFLKTGVPTAEGPVIPPDANEAFAPKDTVKAHQTGAKNKGMMTKIIMTFDLPKSAAVTAGARLPYVWHCHILDHEDNDMMRPFEVIV